MFQVRIGPGSFISHMGSEGEINANLADVGRYKVRNNNDNKQIQQQVNRGKQKLLHCPVKHIQWHEY